VSRIEDAIARSGNKALISYVTVGYPDIETTMKVVPILADSGCDIIELGIPFSDPLADGTTIQRASYHSLQQGTTPGLCLETARKLSTVVAAPLVFMTYFNPVNHYGIEAFCRDCTESGVSGMIIPDLPPEEGEETENICFKHGLDLIYLLAPTSTDERIRLVSEKSHGFIYLVSLTGVTGARNSLPEDLETFVSRVRNQARQPLCVGFGISTADEASRVSKVADGVIVGSRIIQLMEEDGSLTHISPFIRNLKEAISCRD